VDVSGSAFQPNPQRARGPAVEAVEIRTNKSIQPAKTARQEARVFRSFRNPVLENAKAKFSMPFTFLMRTSIALCQTE
jgi:hypothetical protein